MRRALESVQVDCADCINNVTRASRQFVDEDNTVYRCRWRAIAIYFVRHQEFGPGKARYSYLEGNRNRVAVKSPLLELY